MANLRPFRGLRYSPDKECNLSDVVTAPYDRIHEAEQADYYELSPYNVVRILQGLRTDEDTDENNVYTRAEAYKRNWLAEGVLIHDPEPALYVVEQRFTTPDGVERTRVGVTVALELTGFDEGAVLPHEYTLRGPKIDRLKLTEATQTAWGHIFMLYPDSKASFTELLQPFMDSHMPAIVYDEVIEPDVEQNFWVITDPDVIDAVTAEMSAHGPLIIADGHHRYETALGYRDAMREQHPDAPADAAFNYVLATLVSMDDPGLIVLPTHRLIHSYTAMTGEQVLAELAAHFEITLFADIVQLQGAMAEATPGHPRYGFYDDSYSLLTLKSMDVVEERLPTRDPNFRELDVTVLHEIIIEMTMGLSKESVRKRENLSYLRDPSPGLAAVDQGEANFLFLLNPTKIEQVRACTAAGERMPQKSTDFYPKIISGLVALPLTGTL